MRLAISNDWRSADPTIGIKRVKAGTFHTWTEDEIAKFEPHWVVASPERLAFALLLYTGQRRSDVVRVSGVILQAALPGSCSRRPRPCLILSLHPDLKQILAQWPKTHLMILTTSHGRPFTPAGLAAGWRTKSLPPVCLSRALPTGCARPRHDDWPMPAVRRCRSWQ
jgi:enterobacteria phage integrase